MSSPTSAAHQVAVPLLEIGRAWMLDDATIARGRELGMQEPLSFWLHGRAGVLGEVESDVVAAAVGFVAPGLVRSLWEDDAPSLRPRERAIEYSLAAGRWGDRVFADVDPAVLERVTELSAQIAHSVDASIGVLFAGWRSLPLPNSPAGTATVAMNVVRELRGGAHLIAVNAVGLGPHGAIMSFADEVRGGKAGSERFGWPSPHPAVDAQKRADAEQLTTLIASHAFDWVTDAERSEYVELTSELHSLL